MMSLLTSRPQNADRNSQFVIDHGINPASTNGATTKKRALPKTALCPLHGHPLMLSLDPQSASQARRAATRLPSHGHTGTLLLCRLHQRLALLDENGHHLDGFVPRRSFVVYRAIRQLEGLPTL